MVKALGTLLIIGASSFLGFKMAMDMKRRIRELEKFISALGLLETEISYGKRNLKTALGSIGKSQNEKIFLKTAENMERMGIKEALELSLKMTDTGLADVDKEPIELLAQSLGMTDTASQISALNNTSKKLMSLRDDAEREYTASGRLYRSAGVLGGIFTVILLI